MPREQRERFYFKHIVEGLLRGNAKDRAVFYKTMWGNGFFTQNEVRELEDKDPDPNPLADELFIMANMVPLGKYEEYLAKNAGKLSGPDQIPAPDAPKGKLNILDSRIKN